MMTKEVGSETLTTEETQKMKHPSNKQLLDRMPSEHPTILRMTLIVSLSQASCLSRSDQCV